MTTPREERLAEALKEACELAHEGWTYAPEYFQQKWGSAERLAACRAALAEEPRSPAAPPEETDRAPRLPDAIGEAIHAFAEAHRAAEAVGEHASIADQRAAIVATDDAYCNLVEAIRAALASYRSSRPGAGKERGHE